MNKRAIIIGLASLVVLSGLGFGGYWYYQNILNNPDDDTNQEEQNDDGIATIIEGDHYESGEEPLLVIEESGQEATIEITKEDISKRRIVAPKGTLLKWVNVSDTKCTFVISKSDKNIVNKVINAGDTLEYTAQDAGLFQYSCQEQQIPEPGELEVYE